MEVTNDGRVYSEYLHPMFCHKTRRELLSRAEGLIHQFKLKPTGIVGTGLSGVTFATLLAHHLRINPVFVRKENDGTHSSHLIEGVDRSILNRFLIVDDTIDSGKTILRIVKTLKNFCITNVIRHQFYKIGFLYNEELGLMRKCGIDFIPLMVIESLDEELDNLKKKRNEK
jgi:orotate phosphoribosyltransferase